MIRKKVVVFAGVAICFAAGAALVAGLLMRGEKESAPAPQDLSLHPIYSTYPFSPPEGHIRIGTQPFRVYGANIMEVMQRDRLLQQDLNRFGLTAEFYPFLKGPDANYFMAKGRLDVSMGGYLPTLSMTTEQDLLIPSMIDQCYCDLVTVNCRTIKDLSGWRIGFSKGSDSHHALVEALETAGVTAYLIPMNGDEMPEAMHTGRIDACMAWEPLTSQLLAENPEAHVVYRRRRVTFLYFRGDFAKRHPDAVSAVLAAQARAIRWINESQDNLRLSSRWAIKACRNLSPGTAPPELDEFVKQARETAAQSPRPVVFQADFNEGNLLSSAFAFLKKERMIPQGALWERTRAMFNMEQMNAVLNASGRWRLDEFDYETGEQP